MTKSSQSILHSLSECLINLEDFVIFVIFLENMNFSKLPFTEFRKINIRSFSTKRDNNLKIGISISCRQENTCNATILKTDPLGIASQKLLVGKGDTIIGINGVSLIDATYNEIVAAIRSSKDTIKILVQEARAGREEFEPTPPPSFCYLLCCF